MENSILEEFVQTYQNAEMVVIGLGLQLHEKQFENIKEIECLQAFYEPFVQHKNYFVITSHQNNIFEGAGWNSRRIVCPLCLQNTMMEKPDKENIENIVQKQWDLYNKWLSATINHRLMLVELGEDFSHPNLFRWPFEKINFINRKSKLYRIHDVFYQLPDNLSDRAVGIRLSAKQFLIELKAFIEGCC